MKLLDEILNEIVLKSIKDSGFEPLNIKVTPCEREDLGEFTTTQCLALAKIYHKSPMEIANIVLKNIPKEIFKDINIASPGFINFTLNEDFLSEYLLKVLMSFKETLSSHIAPQKTIIDYGGANVAKPLHVGHLRSATIGESIKRICKFVGNETLGDVHLGDWGLQMGMVISEIKRLHKDLPYFDKNFKGEYPTTPPITIKDLETLYPAASKRARENEDAMQEARQITFDLQNGERGYVALWKHIINVSKKDLKKNYDALDVHFDLWLGESDTLGTYENMIKDIKNKNLCYESEGALVVDVKEEGDKKDVPPFILLKSDGAVLYSTTDLATLVNRDKMGFERVIYVVDNRQEMHFTQLFRTAKKCQLLKNIKTLDFAGFGTMNGTDGKPYKTRDGSVMKLESLMNDVYLSASKKALNNLNSSLTKEEIENISNTVALSALKFADLSIFRAKDYIFDVDKFTSFEGKTGPYLLYTLTRAKSILKKAEFDEKDLKLGNYEKPLLLHLSLFPQYILQSYYDLSPSVLCDFAYKLANLFNGFYAKTNIIREKDEDKKKKLLSLTHITKSFLETTLNLLGIKTLEKM